MICLLAVIVAAYDERWPALFEEARAELTSDLGQTILEIHHVGSTAVPGLCAKPVLDILVSISNLKTGVELVPQVAELGYEFRPDDDIPDRRFFRRRHETVRQAYMEGKCEFVSNVVGKRQL